MEIQFRETMDGKTVSIPLTGDGPWSIPLGFYDIKPYFLSLKKFPAETKIQLNYFGSQTPSTVELITTLPITDIGFMDQEAIYGSRLKIIETGLLKYNHLKPYRQNVLVILANISKPLSYHE